ncbi:MAG: O-antigen ligase family protein, partial [Chloroflexi bacterium]|nr:O-antigen ligase family protein [Chloroflexota bacterium]
MTAAISVWVLVETETRGAFAGLIAGVVTMAMLMAVTTLGPRVRGAAIAIAVGVPLVMVGLFVIRDTPFAQGLAERNSSVATIVDLSLDAENENLRVSGLRIAGQAFADNPLAGIGPENFEVAFQYYQRAGEISEATLHLDRAHNKPLDLLATSGVVGFAAYSAVWLWLVALAWRHVRRGGTHAILHAGVAGALVTLFIHELFLFDTSATLLVFALFAAWASAAESRKPWSGLPGPPPGFSRYLKLAAVPVVAILVIVGVYGMNIRTFQAAQLFIETGATVEEVADNLDHFSPLATFGRERLLNVMSGRWDGLDPIQRLRLIPALDEQAGQALAAEPDNMDLQFAVARFYRAAAINMPELMERARFHTDRGIELGPNTVAAAKALVEQDLAEAEMPSSSGG